MQAKANESTSSEQVDSCLHSSSSARIWKIVLTPRLSLREYTDLKVYCIFIRSLSNCSCTVHRNVQKAGTGRRVQCCTLISSSDIIESNAIRESESESERRASDRFEGTVLYCSCMERETTGRQSTEARRREGEGQKRGRGQAEWGGPRRTVVLAVQHTDHADRDCH